MKIYYESKSKYWTFKLNWSNASNIEQKVFIDREEKSFFLFRQYPEQAIKLIFSEPLGLTAIGKIKNLIAGYRASQHEVIVLIDSDVHIASDFLSQSVGFVESPKTGAAFAVPRYIVLSLTTNKITMSSTRSIPLIINVEPQLKNDFKALCERQNVSIASEIQDYMQRSIYRDSVNTSDGSHTHFRAREIETLKNLADNYNKLLDKFNSLQKRVSQLEQLVKKGWGI